MWTVLILCSYLSWISLTVLSSPGDHLCLLPVQFTQCCTGKRTRATAVHQIQMSASSILKLERYVCSAPRNCLHHSIKASTVGAWTNRMLKAAELKPCFLNHLWFSTKTSMQSPGVKGYEVLSRLLTPAMAIHEVWEVTALSLQHRGGRKRAVFTNSGGICMRVLSL